MDPHTPPLLLPPIDWLALLLCAAGALLGSMAGLARTFGLFLWTLAALWLGDHLSARIVDWMPNALDPTDPSSHDRVQVGAFALIALLVLAVPVAGRILGGAGGKKRSDPGATHKPFGALLGLVVTVLLVTLLLPLARRVPWLRDDWKLAKAPIAAATIADHATWLYPEAQRKALRDQ
jgi:uncharacterized membrane protein required for colicin V production